MVEGRLTNTNGGVAMRFEIIRSQGRSCACVATDQRALMAARGWGATAGNRMVTVVPWWGGCCDDSMSIVPPHRSMMELARASPMPLPPAAGRLAPPDVGGRSFVVKKGPMQR